MPKLPKGALEALNHSLMTPATGEAVSPLSALLATRLSAQLEALQQGPLSGLQGVNLPAAYAGDQRSLRAAQRRLSEEEQGIASPSRRKFIKQAAAGAARSVLPDSLATGMTTALEEATKSGIIRDAVSAPVGTWLEQVLGKELLRQLKSSTKEKNLVSQIFMAKPDLKESVFSKLHAADPKMFPLKKSQEILEDFDVGNMLHDPVGFSNMTGEGADIFDIADYANKARLKRLERYIPDFEKVLDDFYEGLPDESADWID